MEPGIFISHSSRDDPFAWQVQEELLGALGGRGYRVLLDKAQLNPGDLWRPKLLRWLAECDGAVLLLNEAALASDWVRNEVTILMWRRALQPRLRVVPVLLPGVSRTDMTAAFPALYVEEAQVLTAAAADAGEAQRLAATAAGQFTEQPGRDDGLGRWTRDIAALLEGVHPNFREQLAEALPVEEADWRLDGGCLTLAAGLLHATTQTAIDALDPVVRAAPAGAQQLVEWVAPGYVPAATAAQLAAAATAPGGQRLIAVNAQFFETVELYVRRATCWRPRVRTLGPLPAASGEDVVQELYEACEELLEQAIWGFPSKRPMSERLARVSDLIVIVIGQGEDGLAARTAGALLTRLRTAFPQLLFVLLTGPDYPAAADLGLPALPTVQPPLDPDKEWDDRDDVGRLRMLVKGAR